MAHSASRVIEVPIDNSNDVLEIDCSQLPEHASEICDILENEGSALRFYRLFALEYYRQGLAEEAVVALKRGIASAKANDQTSKVPLLNLLASVYVQKAKAIAAAPAAGAAPAADDGRDMLLQMATALLTEAERISRTDPNTCLVKGMLAMAKRLPDAALIQFNSTLRIAPQNVAALLGKARILYGRRQFQQALAVYQQVLVLRPTEKPDPRIGIGMCLYRLGHTDDARRALTRATAVDPAAAAPHLVLATMDLNEIKRTVDPRINRAVADPSALEGALQAAAGCLKRAMEHLQRAYELQPDSAAALICLADRLFCKSDLGGARKLAGRALGTADTMALQAEAHYQIGRAHHAEKQFDLAYESYQRCLAINERHGLARYGLGQMQLQRTDMSSAEAAFQRVLERHPRCVEVLRALGYLHARLPNTKAKALEYYEREMQVLADEAAEHAKSLGRAVGDVAEWFDDANLFLEAGLLYEGVSAKKARKAYAVAAQVLGRVGGSGGDAIPELWNNLGALSQLTDEPDEAVAAAYGQATERCMRMLADVRARAADRKSAHPQRPSNELRRLENTLASTTYNVARFYEHCGLWERAERLYQHILAHSPAYTDARLRLAYVAFFYRGDSEGALAHISQAIDADAKRPVAWLMRGSIELHRKNVQVARRAFEHVLKDISKHDVYALCSLGNYYLAAGKSESTRAANEPNTASAAAKKALDLSAQNYKRALEFFDKCLQLDERCAAAAHGAAIAIAERGFATEARRLFQEVRDAATSGLGPLALCSPASDLVFKTPGLAAATAGAATAPLRMDDMRVGCDVLLWSGVNAAHASVEIGSYRQAILVYEACIKRIHDTTAALENAGSAGDADLLVISALEETAKAAQSKDAADAANGSTAVAAAKMSSAERSERQRTTRDLRLYLVRAQYIQAKTTKDMDILRAALREICALCAEAAISIPETDAKGDAQELADPAAADADAAGEETKADGDDDVDMGSASDAAETPAAAGDGDNKDPASKKPRVRLSPEDSLLLFDQALVEQLVAQLSSDLPVSQRSLEDIDAAASNLEHSTAAFTFLASWGKSMQKKKHKLLFSPRLASERAGYGKSLVAKLARKRQEQVDFERQRQEQAEQWRKQQEETATRKREEADRAERERDELETKILRETEERNTILREQMAADAARQTAEAAAAPAPRSRKPKQRGDNDGFISDNDDLDDAHHGRTGAASGSESELQPVAVPREKKRLARGTGRTRVRKPADAHTDEDDAGAAPTPAPKKRRGPRAAAPADGAESQPHRETGSSSSKYKSKAIISDSDISDE
ncbi:protein required for normal CLN1 and CLN2 G1 cyclin expression [Coemansia spiralis]|nr:protein required for normal CLN1 and CLN2 G1 cyclin expression [Coemansia spiralis]